MVVAPVIADGVPGPDPAVPPEYEIKAEKSSVLNDGIGSPFPASTSNLQQPEHDVVKLILIFEGPLTDIPHIPG